MTHLFYALGFLPFLFELITLSGKTDKATLDLKGNLGFVYIVWIFIGLFSSQWIFFLALLILSMIDKRPTWYKKLDAYLCIAIIISIIISKYHA